MIITRKRLLQEVSRVKSLLDEKEDAYWPFGGNCGTFAAALYQFIFKKFGLKLDAAVFSNEGEGVKSFRASQFDESLTVYHVCLYWPDEDLLIDGDGEASYKSVLRLCKAGYGDSNPAVSQISIDPSGPDSFRYFVLFIHSQTGWSVSEKDYLSLMSKE